MSFWVMLQGVNAGRLQCTELAKINREQPGAVDLEALQESDLVVAPLWLSMEGLHLQ
jgi:hypothetical protein